MTKIMWTVLQILFVLLTVAVIVMIPVMAIIDRKKHKNDPVPTPTPIPIPETGSNGDNGTFVDPKVIETPAVSEFGISKVEITNHLSNCAEHTDRLGAVSFTWEHNPFSVFWTYPDMEYGSEEYDIDEIKVRIGEELVIEEISIDAQKNPNAELGPVVPGTPVTISIGSSNVNTMVEVGSVVTNIRIPIKDYSDRIAICIGK